MTPEALLVALRGRGVALIADGDRLRWRAPAGVLTDTDRDALTAAKPALLTLLSDRGKPPESPAKPNGMVLGVTDVMEVFPGARVVTPDEAEPDPDTARGYAYGPTPPAGPCPVCGGLDWHRAGSGWTCSTCHPAPARADAGLTVAALQAQVIELTKAEGFPGLDLKHGHVVQPGERHWTHWVFTLATRPLLLRARDALAGYRAAGNGRAEREPGKEG